MKPRLKEARMYAIFCRLVAPRDEAFFFWLTETGHALSNALIKLSWDMQDWRRKQANRKVKTSLTASDTNDLSNNLGRAVESERPKY